jgi:lariat debranching enzyme
MIEREIDQIKSQGLLVPEILKEGQETTPLPALVWERGLIDVDRVQRFWPTAPAHGEAGGSDSEFQLKLSPRRSMEIRN